MAQILQIFYILVACLAMNVLGQQNYSGLSAQNCESNPKSQLYLYTCNGENRFCQAFLIFKSKPPYNSVKTISNLTSSSPKELAGVNNVTESQVFPTNKEVIIPVNCSCVGQYYQKNTSIILGELETYYIVANEILQGLSTCDSLMRDNTFGELDLSSGQESKVPLRCARPTKSQTQNGSKYPVNNGDSISDIGTRFKVSEKSIFCANGFSEDGPDPTIFISTPILIPLPNEPSSSLTIIQNSDDDDAKTPTFPPLIGSSPRRPKSKRKLYTVLAITVGCSRLVLVVASSVFFLVYKKRPKVLLLPRRESVRRRLSPEDLRSEIASFEKGTLQVYGIEEIKEATESFSSKKQIKGSVFQGVFGEDSTTLAVKRTRKDLSNEVNILKKLNHFNLIKLEGVCKYQDLFYLVFEYLENGSLREWLCENCSERNWSWATRIQIALDIANGLNYLHSFTKPGYVHKNIKSTNILLDGNMRAKISNFGLAGPATELTTTPNTSTAADNDQSRLKTTSYVVGKRRYIDPEYLATGFATPKIDVFAFGVVVLELMTRKNAIAVQDGTHVLLSKAFAEIMEGDCPEADLDLFIDLGLREDHRYKEFALRVAKLSVVCLKRDPESRPSMSERLSQLCR